MAEDASARMVDLERELSCSICTELLYQPLTLLDCLHTFCGACLKEWFAFQASTATSLHPYTCPSCRASVRSTQPNATVTTLLDMFIKANPERGKSEQDKKNDREKFKPGDNVLPKLRRREDPGADEERRLLEEVQQLSLREVGIPTSSGNGGAHTLEPPRDRRRDRSRETSRESRRGRDERRSRSHNASPAAPPSRDIVPPRVIEHQSSLRSLLSASEIDSQEIEEEIMRQIMEEGLLDGIDLNNIDVAQEDEISERIAQAYRRRQAERQRERRERRERLAREGLAHSATVAPQDVRSPLVRDDETSRHRPGERSGSRTSTPQNSSRPPPPVSNPGLIQAANQGRRTAHRRSSSQGSTRSSRRAERPPALSVSSIRQENDRPSTPDCAPPTRRRQSDNQHRTTLEERQQFRNSISSSNPNSPRRSAFNIPASESPSSSTAVVSSPLSTTTTTTTPASAPLTQPSHPPASRRTTDPTGVRQPRPTTTSTPPLASPATFPRPNTDTATSLPHSRQPSIAPTLYAEPQIACRKCNKEHIEYDLHFNCSRCEGGDYNVCRSCYRHGRGCKHWFGFGWAAWKRYEQKAPPGGYPPNHEHPHILVGRRYYRPSTPLTESTQLPHRLMSEDDPAHRLESGVFCDICKVFANSCYWKCDICNEGEWGFCNDCVNQGKHCTHPLLPVMHKPRERRTDTNSSSTPSTPRPESSSLSPGPTLSSHSPGAMTPPLTPRTASLIRGPGEITIVNTTFRPLTFTTICNVCTYPIPPSNTRYHCLKCNTGDYDICMSCYHKLVVVGRISKENGMNGWRRCLRGHRMVIVGFEDRNGGQRRKVVRDLVGGHALRDDGDTANGANSPQSPTAASLPAPRERAENYTWRETDGSVHRYRSPTSTAVGVTSASTSSPPPGGAVASAAAATAAAAAAAVAGQRFPPDGGVGLRVQAKWGYFPDEGVKDELMFPKFAEIREAEDINRDWFWGVYAGVKGLFPGNFGVVIGGMEERGRLI